MRHAGGPRRLVPRDHGARAGEPARPSRWTPSTRSTSSTPAARRPSRRASCTRPAATSPASARLTATSSTCTRSEDVFWCAADVGWVTGHSYIVYGPLANGATSVMYEGAPDYPHQGIWWELIQRYGVTILYTAPTAIRSCIKWGRQAPAGLRPELAAAARDGRRADQPEGVAVVPQGDRARTLSDRRHLVADGDRCDR